LQQQSNTATRDTRPYRKATSAAQTPAFGVNVDRDAAPWEYAMKSLLPVAIALSCLSLQSAVASADEVSPPRTTATRPAREHPEETSLPSNAPAATRTQTTGSNSQNPTTKRMNEEGLKKLQIEGK
jgi:hypothetical protein